MIIDLIHRLAKVTNGLRPTLQLGLTSFNTITVPMPFERAVRIPKQPLEKENDDPVTLKAPSEIPNRTSNR